MAGVAINLCELVVIAGFAGFIPNKAQSSNNDMIERFVWRLDCRLKYVCYLLVIKFVIFGYFCGKMYLFLMSLWRALQLTSVN